MKASDLEFVMDVLQGYPWTTPNEPSKRVSSAMAIVHGELLEACTTPECRLNRLVLEMYERRERKIVPKFPWVFVRTLKREMLYSGKVILPERQNKVMLEGIVLATWMSAPRRFYNVNSKQWEHPELYRSELQPGEHVLFPHFAGMPAPGYDPADYRLIKECNWLATNEGGISAVLDYDKKERTAETLKAILIELMLHMPHAVIGTSDLSIKETIDALLERFILVDKQSACATTSGR